ncbi:tetratricopeptide repeat protein [Streptomyces guryensis]|uniref:Tetratricopeptide repeat protein n=1 Tax=Streptomyces guryensis TaxID=2886947 RepID=A0A9Q3VMC5_9ACTN|nr:tetratricopeptide repeat protein [Streptomyces guryensis]MCD9875184.1 tetratricopeptide repeat protein [Streptomyces guryensis]
MSALFDRRPAVDASVEASAASAVAAGRDIGQAITAPGAVGMHIENATLLSPDACPPAADVACPAGVFHLPTRAALFVGRDPELALLDEALATPGQALVHAMHGLGGIGKSALAARWASGRVGKNRPVWWITADSRAAVDAGLAKLAAALCPSLVTLLAPEQLAEWARQWLASHSDWLLVLDNVSDPADVYPLLSQATSGRSLITSRRSTGWQGIAERVELDVLTVEEAVDLFNQIRGGAEPADVAALCAELGCLPLAVAQAAAYCAQTHCTPREYLDDLAAYPAEMYAATEEGGDNERTIARIWHLTLDRLADDPLAVRLLLMLGWYAPEGIPRSLFGPLGKPPAVRGALGRLAAHSMITLYDDTVSVHRLVQAVSRTPAEGDDHRHTVAVEAARKSAVRTLAAAIPEDPYDPSAWSTMRLLLPHVEALIEHAGPETDTETTARLLAWTADQLSSTGPGLAPKAIALFERTEAARSRLFGAESAQTLETRAALAYALYRADDHERAVPLAERVLADCVRALGDDHDVTLTARLKLARMLRPARGNERVGALLEDVVARRARILGKQHPRTFQARKLLALNASDHRSYPDARSAMDLLDTLFEECRTALGADHHVTLSIQGERLTLAPEVHLMKSELGEMFEKFGFYGSADPSPDAMPGMVAAVKALGPTGMSNMMGSATHPDEAERYAAACERVYGKDHPKTLTARITLAGAYAFVGQGGNLSQAVDQVVSDAARMLGTDDSIVSTFRGLRDMLKQFPLLQTNLSGGLEELAARARQMSPPSSPGSAESKAEAIEPILAWFQSVRESAVNGTLKPSDMADLLNQAMQTLVAVAPDSLKLPLEAPSESPEDENP